MQIKEIRTNEKIRTILKLIVTLSLLGYVFYSTGPYKIIDQIKNVKILYFLMALLLGILGVLISSKKLQILLRVKGVEKELLKVFKIYYLGQFASLFLPSTIGGDVVKGISLSEKSENKTEPYTSVFMERYTGLIALILLATFSILIKPNILTKNLLIGYLAVTISTLSLTIFIFVEKIHKVVTNLIRKIPYGIGEKLEKMYKSVNLYKKNKKIIMTTLTISLIFQIIAVIVIFFLAKSINLYIPFLYLLVMVPVTQLILILPISIQGYGVREIIYIQFLSEIGISNPEAVGLAIIVGIYKIINNSIGSISLLNYKTN